MRRVVRSVTGRGPRISWLLPERGRLVWRLADLIEQHAEDFAVLDSLDNGKPITASRAADVPLSVDLFRYMAGWSTKLLGDTIPAKIPYQPDSEFFTLNTTPQPVGVFGQIIPWNFPLMMAAWKLGPASAVGCTVVLKPAEQTPLSVLLLGELVEEAGFPDGVYNSSLASVKRPSCIERAPGREQNRLHRLYGVGKEIVAQSAENLKRFSLELGESRRTSCSPTPILSRAIPAACDAVFFNQGQACCAGSRLLVERAAVDEVVEGLCDRAAQIRIGPGLDPETEMGPLISQVQRDRVIGYIDSSREDGGTVAAGGGSIGGARRVLRGANGPSRSSTSARARPARKSSVP